jgi:nucleoside-diphosphate-sugar epimerase
MQALHPASRAVVTVGYRPTTDEDYQPSTLHSESKVRTEQILRQPDGGGLPWCIVWPTTIWRPGLSARPSGCVGGARRASSI